MVMMMMMMMMRMTLHFEKSWNVAKRAAGLATTRAQGQQRDVSDAPGKGPLQRSTEVGDRITRSANATRRVRQGR
eukprot:9380883-Karenia_brevis.AAC.1